ncbi:hypothetical protein COCNU_scaffold004319G000020 [Cocos nucifera]|nr:hypothetical protein [Cocos nucifera]
MAAMEDFLKECERSGDAAYAAFKALLERLECPATRSDARVFLAVLSRRFDSKDAADRCFHTYHFRIHDVLLADFEGHQKRKKLTMMEIPSIFIPEDWSFTFYEGINRHPASIFEDKTVAELGCGNGWISIAIAEKWSPLKVYGLDINPRAVKVARINLFLNALDENGLPIYDEEGKTLLDRVEFHESDLLAYCRDNKIELDRIVGCIPQILNPNPQAMSKMITENSSEEFLYSLSNYCALQGFVEDQFGLGLIARAVEEGIAVIKPMGIMIFNIGGRPGQGAADTDISALVKTIFDFLKNGFQEVSSSLDLSFDDESVADEKIPFLSYLASVLKENSFLPHEPPAGSNVTVFPSRAVAIENALRLFSPQLAVVDEHLTRHLPKQWLTSLAIERSVDNGSVEDTLTVIEAPRQSDLMIELIKKLKPQRECADTKSAEMIGFANQSFLPTPSAVKASIFESFARQNMVESETDVRSGIQQLVMNSYGFSSKFMKANIMTIPTHSEVGFKLVPETLATLLGTVRRPWLYISGPTINPTGLLYSNEEIKDILAVCAKFGARVVIDTYFSGSSFCVSLLGGLSFELLTGGLEPHSTVKYAIKKLLGLRMQKAQHFVEAIVEQKKILKNRSDHLMKTLHNCGWDVVSCCGGVSLVAKPTAYIGKMLKIDGFEAKLDDSNFREAVLRATGLCINSGLWTGIPNYCRFTIALETAEFDRAVQCITQFKKLVFEI